MDVCRRLQRVISKRFHSFFVSYILKEKARIMQDTEQKKQLNFTSLVSTTHEIPKYKCVSAKNAPYVKWGEDNNFPDYLFELFKNSSQMAAIILQMKNYVLGSGITSNFPLKIVNRKLETFENFIDKLVFDYLLYGGFSFQIIKNKLGQIAELNHLDFKYIRVDEDETKVFFSKDWSKGRRTPLVYDRWDINSNSSNSVFYFKGFLTRECYPMPFYISCLTSLEISTQIGDFHLNNLLNGFSPSCIINFNNGSNISEDVQDEIEDAVKEKFCGTENASRILLSFNDDMTHKTTFERLQDDGMIDKYNNLQQTTEKDIFRAFRMNKLLLGDGSENTGFNKQAYLESFALYNKSVIEPIQRELEGVLDISLGKGSVKFNKFELDWGADEDQDTSKLIE